MEASGQMEAYPVTLRFTVQQDSISIIWEADIIGRRTSQFHMPYTPNVLRLIIRALDAFQHPLHPTYGPQFDEAEKGQLRILGLWSDDHIPNNSHHLVGHTIFQALTADPKGASALSTVRDYATANGLPLAFLLRFPPDAPLLASLPWETIWDEHEALLLSRGKLASCVRYLDLDQALPPIKPLGDKLRILAVAPAADIPEEIRAAERAARMRAWQPLIDANLVSVEELYPATPASLVDRLQLQPSVDIVHYYGHGRYKNGQGALLLDTSDGSTMWLSADRLAALLGDVRLIVLHACQSAMTSEAGLLTGIAPALSAAGVPVVIAMQLTIRVDAATRFAAVVYRSLARGESVQQAVAKARQALYVEENDETSWFVPTITVRARNTEPLRFIEPSRANVFGRTSDVRVGSEHKVDHRHMQPDVITPSEGVNYESLAHFVAGPPITHPKAFFGREKIIRRIFNLLKATPLQNAVIIGPRRSGKTSLLYYLRSITATPSSQLRIGQRNDWLTEPQRYRWVMVDFQDVRLSRREGLFGHILTSLNLQVPHPCTIDHFLDAMISGLHTPTVILFDEIGRALQNYPDLDDEVWESLRAVGPQVKGRLGFVLASHTSPVKQAHDSGHSSPFFNIFGYTANLGPFTEEEARLFINSSPIPFSADDKAWILEQSKYWPILLQILCRERLNALESDDLSDEWRAESLKQLSLFREKLTQEF